MTCKSGSKPGIDKDPAPRGLLWTLLVIYAIMVYIYFKAEGWI